MKIGRSSPRGREWGDGAHLVPHPPGRLGERLGRELPRHVSYAAGHSGVAIFLRGPVLALSLCLCHSTFP